MAKKKQSGAEVLPGMSAENLEESAPEVSAPAQPAVTDQELDTLINGQWQAGIWNDRPTLTCSICKWDTLDGVEAALAYMKKCVRCSPPPEPPKPIIVQAYDRFGNPIGG